MNASAATVAAALLERHRAAVEAFLRQLIGSCRDAPPRLLEAISYSALSGGKMFRPALVLETFAACAGEQAPAPSALAAAAAVELIHTFSLVHDDLPAMDNDDLRRGRPTSHRVFGEALAILAGDAMVALAFETIARHAAADLVPMLTAELAAATGPAGMIGGQVLDIDSEHRTLSLEQLSALHARKTGALITASCRMGAIAARAPAHALEAVTAYGRHAGLAFQIVDDILDVTSTAEQLGKAARKDAARGKNTYPGLLGVEAARAEALRQCEAATAALAPLKERAAGLRALAEFVVMRGR